MTIEELLNSTRSIAASLGRLDFSSRIAYVYNPLEYAWKPYCRYVSLFGAPPKRVLFFGMNPGPWGMAQTGVPFGEVGTVKEWLGIEEPVSKPLKEHPKRPVTGFDCPRSEASGLRLWGLFKERFGTPESFFSDHFIANYCPLLFFDAEGKNITPDKLIKSDRQELYRLCDEHAAMLIDFFTPEFAVGIGKFTAARLEEASSRAGTAGQNTATGTDPAVGENRGSPKVCSVLHPSPASPKANRGWAEQAVKELKAAGVW